MAKEGWIKVYRKLQSCDIWLFDTPFDERSAWIDLILTASHRDTEIYFDGKPMPISRGQIVTSVRKLAHEWHWGKDKTLEYLRYLERAGMITKVSDSRKTLITIENYSAYQGIDSDDTRQSADTEQTPNRHRAATYKNEKNEKNEKNSVDELLLIDQYPISVQLKPKVADWLKYKKERREGYKEIGLKSLLTQIANKEAEAGSQAVIDVIDLSMSNGWKGIIWDRMGKPSKAETKFHNFDMKHNYDFDEMEKRLLE